MKRITMTAVFTVLVASLVAQSVSFPTPYKNLWVYRPSIYTTPVGQDDENNYFFVHERAVATFKPKTYTDHLYIVNKESMQKEDVAVTVANKYNFLGGVCGDNSVYGLYESLPGKGDKIVFTLADLGKRSRSFTLSDENTVTASANPKFWPDFKTAKSPDGKLLAALAIVTGKDNVLESLFAVVVNNEGEFLWSGPVTPQFAGKTSSFGDLAVDNNGTVYLPAYTCLVTGKNVSNVQFMMIRTTADGSDSFTEGIDFGTPQNFTAKVLASGDVAVAGYYTDSKTTTATQTSGYYFYRFDPKSESITDIRSFKFNEGYVEREAWARFATVLGNQQYSVSADNIFELENGSLVLCGEHRYVKSIYNQQMNSTTYQMLTKNILVSTLLPDGTSHFTMIEKQQGTSQGAVPGDDWRPAGISYTAFAHHNDMYFMFSEDPKNIPYPGKGTVCSPGGMTYKDAWTNVLMRLTPDQGLTQREIKDPNQLLRAVDFVDAEHFYASGIGKSDIFLSKYEIEK